MWPIYIRMQDAARSAMVPPVRAHQPRRRGARGVSQPTVSRALRDDPRVATETIGRVKRERPTRSPTSRAGAAAAFHARHRPDRRRRPRPRQPFYSEAIRHLHGALAAAADGRVHTVLPDRPLTAGDSSTARSTPRSSRPRGWWARRSRQPSRPRAPGGAHSTGRRAATWPDACETDNAGRRRALAAFLDRLGHTERRRRPRTRDTSTGRDRERGFRAGLGHEPVAEHHGPFAFATGHDGLTAVVAGPADGRCSAPTTSSPPVHSTPRPRPRASRSRTALTVVGFDDIAMAAWPVFALTTMRQDLAAMASTATSLLVERMAAPAAPARRRVIRATLVERASHARTRGMAGDAER